MDPISDTDLEVFETMHTCPNTRPEGGCQKCAFVERIRQQQRTIALLTSQLDASSVELWELREAKRRIDAALKLLSTLLPSATEHGVRA